MSPPPFPIRNISFDLGPEVPRHWHPAGRAVTRFLDNLSLFFPDGERFFMVSVQAFAHVAKNDPELRAAIRAFCAQEGIHRREHRKYNDMLAGQGLPVAAMERRVERLIARFAARTPKRWHLGVTAALEHFTSLMGRQVLERPELFEGAHATMRALWRWHAVEETEHRSVAYDLYLAAGGTYSERVFLMLGTALIFWAKVIEHQIRLMHADGDLFSLDEHRKLQRFLWTAPGALPPMWREWLRWFHPRFHPSDLDATELLARHAAQAAGTSV